MSARGRILIADDEETFLHATADLLRREGYECETVPDAPSAGAAVASSRPNASAAGRTTLSIPRTPP